MLTVEELFRKLTQYHPDTPVYFGDVYGDLNGITSVVSGKSGVILMGYVLPKKRGTK